MEFHENYELLRQFPYLDRMRSVSRLTKPMVKAALHGGMEYAKDGPALVNGSSESI